MRPMRREIQCTVVPTWLILFASAAVSILYLASHKP